MVYTLLINIIEKGKGTANFTNPELMVNGKVLYIHYFFETPFLWPSSIYYGRYLGL